MDCAVRDSIKNKKTCTKYLEALIETSSKTHVWDWNCLRINCWTWTSPLAYAIEDECLGCVALLMSQPSVNMDLRKICYYDCCHSFSAAAPENYDRWSSNPLLEYFSMIEKLYYRDPFKLNLDLLNFLIQHPRVNINTKSFEY